MVIPDFLLSVNDAIPVYTQFGTIKPSDISVNWDVGPLLTSVYFSLVISQNIVNYVFLYTLISGVLFENILVNKIILPLLKPKKISNTELEKSEVRVTFWFNDWLYDFKNMEPQDLTEEQMFIPFFRWKKYKHKQVRTFYTRGEKKITSPSRIKQILSTCLVWIFVCLCLRIPLEIYGITTPFRIFILLSIYIVPAVFWQFYLRDLVNVSYLLDEFRTPRIVIIFAIFFGIVPTVFLFSGEIQYLIYDVLAPMLKAKSYKNYKTLINFTKKSIRCAIALIVFWQRFFSGYCFLVIFSGLIDNWWDSSILPRFEKNQLTTYIGDVYRIRNTDKLIAMYAFIPSAIEVFGGRWWSVWWPWMKDLWTEIYYQKLAATVYEKEVFLSPNNDDIVIYNPTLAHQIWVDIITWVEHAYHPDSIKFLGHAMAAIQKDWPGLSPFLLAMLFRGLRFKGPDTYPNFGTAVPELPQRTPIIALNKDYVYVPIIDDGGASGNELRKSAQEKAKRKLIQILPKCKWQKYFVRWNWTFAFTISMLHNYIFRGILKWIVGIDEYAVILVSPETFYNLQKWIVSFEGCCWVYGVMCCFLGRCAYFPILDKACNYHCGKYYPIEDKVKLTNNSKSVLPLKFYPYDVIELKKAINLLKPTIQISLLTETKIWVNVQLKKLKENIPKILFILIILSFCIYSVHEDIVEILSYHTSTTFKFINYPMPDTEWIRENNPEAIQQRLDNWLAEYGFTGIEE